MLKSRPLVTDIYKYIQVLKRLITLTNITHIIIWEFSFSACYSVHSVAYDIWASFHLISDAHLRELVVGENLFLYVMCVLDFCGR